MSSASLLGAEDVLLHQACPGVSNRMATPVYDTTDPRYWDAGTRPIHTMQALAAAYGLSEV